MVFDVAHEQRDALLLLKCRVVGADPERRVDLGERVAMHHRVLADVQAREVKAEDLDLADHVVEVAGRGEHPRAFGEGALDDAQIGDQLRRLAVAGLLLRERRADPLADERERAAVGLLGIALRELLGEPLGTTQPLLRGSARAAAPGR